MHRNIYFYSKLISVPKLRISYCIVWQEFPKLCIKLVPFRFMTNFVVVTCNDGANCSEGGYLERCGFNFGLVEMVTEQLLKPGG